jgi:hypothetical protein
MGSPTIILTRGSLGDDLRVNVLEKQDRRKESPSLLRLVAWGGCAARRLRKAYMRTRSYRRADDAGGTLGEGRGLARAGGGALDRPSCRALAKIAS